MGNLLDKINKDFKEAYLKKEMDIKNYLGFLKSEVTKESKTPEDAYILGKFKSMKKNGLETNSLNSVELEILNAYIPSQMDMFAIRDIITKFAVDKELTNMSGMGLIMTHLKDNYPGEYDGKMASTVAREVLTK